MKQDLNELKRITFDLIKRDGNNEITENIKSSIFTENTDSNITINSINKTEESDNTIEIEESLSLFEQEKRLISKSLLKNKGKRKDTAAELGISERTLYRKLKEFGL